MILSISFSSYLSCCGFVSHNWIRAFTEPFLLFFFADFTPAFSSSSDLEWTQSVILNSNKNWLNVLFGYLLYPPVYVVTQHVGCDLSWSGVKTSVWPNDNGTVTDHQSAAFRSQLGVELLKGCGEFSLHEGYWKQSSIVLLTLLQWCFGENFLFLLTVWSGVTFFTYELIDVCHVLAANN